jgi:hypothetical protein
MGDLLGSLVWEAKSVQYCVIGGGSLQMVSELLPSLRWWERVHANEGRQRGRWVQIGGDCDVPHRLRMRIYLYVYKCTICDTPRFKVVMAMNLSKLRS